MAKSVAAVIAVVFTALFVLFLLWRHRADRKFREDILQNKPRLEDAEYLTKLSFPVAEHDAGLALRFRAVFAGVAKLPKECISPEMPLTDLFRAQAFFFSDGIDLAEIAMEMEDQFHVEIREDAFGPRIDDEDTVETCTAKILACGQRLWVAKPIDC